MNQSSSETKTHKDETTTTRPLPEQMPYLEKAWSQASSLYDKTQANPYTGDFVAAPNQNQYNGYNSLIKWANGTGVNTAQNLLNTGQGQLANGTAGQQGALGGLFNYANSDLTQKNIDTARAYANSQDVQGIVNAGMYAANRNAAENTLPTMYRQAAAGNNVNSDRSTLAQAVVQRGLNEQAQNLGATTMQTLYNQGLSMANAQNTQQLQAYAGAGSLANTMAGQGYSGTQAGFDNYGKALTSSIAGGQGLRELDQLGIDNGLKKYMNDVYMPWQNLQMYYGITGDLKGGTSHTVGDSTSETTQTPSMLSTIGQGIGILGSLFSDERYKDIHSGPVGMWKGVAPAYLYSYKHDPDQLHVGPMAQDVARVRPDAVRDLGGALVIDTHKL